MGYSIGLKLWSTNVDYYWDEAQRLFEKRVFDYIELYVVPQTMHTLQKWKKLPIPFIIHNAHSAHGFNLADANNVHNNKAIYSQTKQFADALEAQYIIFHCGKDGTIEEAVRQLSSLNEPRALVENLPVYPLPGGAAKVCRGATMEELLFVKREVLCGFCLDFGHAVCSGNAQKKNPYAFIKELMALSPKMFHMSDLENVEALCDSHKHLGEGHLDIANLKRNFLPQDAIISIETEKNDACRLDDFGRDVLWLKHLN